ncbi:MAG TPA: hypothetical protein VHE55_15005 [Fimbriimonadaceae bacterium]|nr:hypothetical protein [Fimbriimonadaceae bacterium]
MERQPANALDERIGRMAHALRAEEMPSAPAGMMNHRSARHRPATKTWIMAAAGLVTIAIGVMAMLPRESAAAELDRIVQTADDVLRHELSYDKQSDGTWKITSDIYVDGTRFHSISHSDVADQYISGDRMINYFPKHGYAIVEAYHPRGEGVFFHASLKRQIGFDHVKSVSRAGAVEWKGLHLQRFDLHSEFVDALGQTLTSDGYLLADPATDRPYYEEFTINGDKKGQFVGGRTGAMEWRYPTGEESKLAMDLPPGTKVYDVEKLRQQVKDQVTSSLQSTEIAGIRVTLRGVYASERGALHVFTSGGTGRIERDAYCLRLDGKEASHTWSEGQNHAHRVGDTRVYEPFRYRGVDLIYQAADFGSVPDSFELEVPVWKPDHSRLGRTFAGYAKFENVVPVRIEGEVLTKLGRSILWTEKDFAIEDETWRKAASAPSK